MEQGDRAARISALMKEIEKEGKEMPVCKVAVLSRKEWRLRGVAFGV